MGVVLYELLEHDLALLVDHLPVIGVVVVWLLELPEDGMGVLLDDLLINMEGASE